MVDITYRFANLAFEMWWI